MNDIRTGLLTHCSLSVHVDADGFQFFIKSLFVPVFEWTACSKYAILRCLKVAKSPYFGNMRTLRRAVCFIRKLISRWVNWNFILRIATLIDRISKDYMNAFASAIFHVKHLAKPYPLENYKIGPLWRNLHLERVAVCLVGPDAQTSFIKMMQWFKLRHCHRWFDWFIKWLWFPHGLPIYWAQKHCCLK